jgi:hypothetical protein
VRRQKECFRGLSSLPPSALLALHAQIAARMVRGVLHEAQTNPTGDLAEYVFCKAFGWKQSGNSSPSIDSIDSGGIRYQVKGRRIRPYNKSRQLSAIRDLVGAHFDYLAGVLFMRLRSDASGIDSLCHSAG